MASSVEKLTQRLVQTVNEFTDKHPLDYPARVRAITGALASVSESKRVYDHEQDAAKCLAQIG
jgi:hypothetical protein